MRFSQWMNLTGFPGRPSPSAFRTRVYIGVQVIGRPFEESWSWRRKPSEQARARVGAARQCCLNAVALIRLSRQLRVGHAIHFLRLAFLIQASMPFCAAANSTALPLAAQLHSGLVLAEVPPWTSGEDQTRRRSMKADLKGGAWLSARGPNIA